MNWKVIFTLACFGILMGVASLFGLTHMPVEPILWFLIALFSAYWIAENTPAKPFMHGLVAGVFIGVFNSVIQSAFFEMYLSHNPMAEEGFRQIPGGIPVRLFPLMVGPAIGVAYGLVVGLLSLLATKLFKKPTAK